MLLLVICEEQSKYLKKNKSENGQISNYIDRKCSKCEGDCFAGAMAVWKATYIISDGHMKFVSDY